MCTLGSRSHHNDEFEDKTIAEAESDWVDFDKIFEEYDDGPPFKFEVDVTTNCYKKAISKQTLRFSW